MFIFFHLSSPPKLPNRVAEAVASAEAVAVASAVAVAEASAAASAVAVAVASAVAETPNCKITKCSFKNFHLVILSEASGEKYRETHDKAYNT